MALASSSSSSGSGFSLRVLKAFYRARPLRIAESIRVAADWGSRTSARVLAFQVRVETRARWELSKVEKMMMSFEWATFLEAPFGSCGNRVRGNSSERPAPLHGARVELEATQVRQAAGGANRAPRRRSLVNFISHCRPTSSPCEPPPPPPPRLEEAN